MWTVIRTVILLLYQCYKAVIQTVIQLLYKLLYDFYRNCYTNGHTTVILNIFCKVHQHIVFPPSHNYLPAPPQSCDCFALKPTVVSSHFSPKSGQSFLREGMSCLQFASIIKIYATINTLNCASQAKRNAQREEMYVGEGGVGCLAGWIGDATERTWTWYHRPIRSRNSLPINLCNWNTLVACASWDPSRETGQFLGMQNLFQLHLICAIGGLVPEKRGGQQELHFFLRLICMSQPHLLRFICHSP